MGEKIQSIYNVLPRYWEVETENTNQINIRADALLHPPSSFLNKQY